MSIATTWVVQYSTPFPPIRVVYGMELCTVRLVRWQVEVSFTSSVMAAAVGHHGRTRQDGGSDDGYDDRRGQRADPRGGGGGRPALALVQVPRRAHYPSDVLAGVVIGVAAEAVVDRLFPPVEAAPDP